MGKARQRNHEIPRFLLNRFASRIEANEKRWIWRLGRDGNTRELSTRDVGVSRRFYGDESTGVEDTLAIAEACFSGILVSIDSGRSPAAFSEELPEFIWALAVRTRAVREQSAANIACLLSELAARSGTADARRYVHSSFDEQVENVLARLPLEQRQVAEAFVSAPGVREQLLEYVGSNFSPAISLAVQIVQNRGIVSSSVRQAQIKGLARLLSRGASPGGFKPEVWHVISAHRHSFVLGDGCVFARLEDGGFGSLLKDSKTWCEAYLPISDRQVLVATRGQVRPSLTDTMSINRASAAFALEYIYASRAGPAACDLIPLIGTCEPLLSKDELTEIVIQGFGST